MRLYGTLKCLASINDGMSQLHLLEAAVPYGGIHKRGILWRKWRGYHLYRHSFNGETIL